jgi:hypothetical protein
MMNDADRMWMWMWLWVECGSKVDVRRKKKQKREDAFRTLCEDAQATIYLASSVASSPGKKKDRGKAK